MKQPTTVGERHKALRLLYKQTPEAARISKRVHSRWDRPDAFHGTVVPDNLAKPCEPYGVEWRYGLDRAVGGLHDAPNPGEMLCGALAACADGTVRIIANRLGVELEELDVEVAGHLDVRGTLGIDPSVRVGFQHLAVAIRLRPAANSDAALIEWLTAAAEHFCVVLDTLRGGVPVDVTFECDAAGRANPEVLAGGESTAKGRPT